MSYSGFKFHLSNNKKMAKLKFRLILKDSDNRAVMIDLSGFASLGSGAGEKKLKKAYEDLIKEEKEYKEKNAKK